MPTRIKNWTKFQHFKDRRPPWVKLYRDLLDDREWHQLEPRAAKLLVMLWLIASEDDGNLPSVGDLSFRLRVSEKDVQDALAKLSHWLEQDDIAPISSGYQSDAPETEKRERRDRGRTRADFEKFYEAYPKKKSPGDAEKAFAKVDAPLDVLLAAVEAQKRTEDWRKDGGRYIPYPATWLNQKQWLNDTSAPSITVPGSDEPDAALEKIKQDAKRAVPIPPEIRERMASLKGKVFP